MLNNNKYRKIYESIIRAEILERLDAAKIECYYCERGYCCGCEIQEIRQEAYELGLVEDPCIVCPLDGTCYDILDDILDDIIAEDSVIVNHKEKEEPAVIEVTEPPASPEVSLQIRGNMGIFSIGKYTFKFILSSGAVLKINSNDRNVINVLTMLLKKKGLIVRKVYHF